MAAVETAGVQHVVSEVVALCQDKDDAGNRRGGCRFLQLLFTENKQADYSDYVSAAWFGMG